MGVDVRGAGAELLLLASGALDGSAGADVARGRGALGVHAIRRGGRGGGLAVQKHGAGWGAGAGLGGGGGAGNGAWDAGAGAGG